MGILIRMMIYYQINQDLQQEKSESRYKRASNAYTLLVTILSGFCNEVDILKKGSPDERPMVPPIPTVTDSSVSPDACDQDSPNEM